ncbi:TPA: DUF427 domain-containing protein [Candidatus Woesearchaeota archaeon]|nr:hypothetical protein [archaeon]HIJ10719.1 DUF427 domain-containing protein [Candidatus Woesearchaeota archaeon]|tara:strand:- start:296 stop:583 length:288 start_codon:yes stop_codon:yes gene_type:complete
MTTATWNGHIIAESDTCIEVEGNQYFPSDSLKKEFFTDSSEHSMCPWKGKASYYDIVVNGEINKGAAWYYPDPLPKAKELGITGYVAFWKGVVVA